MAVGGAGVGAGVGSGVAVGAAVGAGAAVAVGSTGIAVGVAGTDVAVAGTDVGWGAVVAVGVGGGLVGAAVGSEPQASSPAARMVRMAIKGIRYRAWVTGILLCSVSMSVIPGPASPPCGNPGMLSSSKKALPRVRAERTASS